MCVLRLCKPKTTNQNEYSLKNLHDIITIGFSFFGIVIYKASDNFVYGLMLARVFVGGMPLITEMWLNVWLTLDADLIVAIICWIVSILIATYFLYVNTRHLQPYNGATDIVNLYILQKKYPGKFTLICLQWHCNQSIFCHTSNQTALVNFCLVDSSLDAIAGRWWLEVTFFVCYFYT